MAIYDLILRDRLSGSARSALENTLRLDRSLRNLDATASRAGRSLERAGSGMRGSGLAFGAVAAGALGAAAAIGRIGYSVARNVIELASFRESSLAALETLTGSPDVAGRAFGNAIAIANQTPLDTRDVVGQSNRLFAAGFSEAEIMPLLGASSDIAAAFGQQRADSFALVASQVRSAGKANRGDLTQALNAGVNTGAIRDSIARQMNIRGATVQSTRTLVDSALSSGRVSGDTFIQGMFDAIRGSLDRGGPLGTFAKRQSETLTGALSNASNAWDNLLLSFGSERLPGVVAFRDGVLAVTSALDGSKPAGAALRGLVSDVMNVLGTRMGAAFSEDNVSGFARALEFARPILTDVLTGILDFGEGIGSGFTGTLGPVMEALQAWGDDGPGAASTLRDVGRAFGFLAAAVALGFGVVATGISGLVEAVDLISELPDSLTYLGDEAAGIAGNFVDGFIGGLDEQWARVTSRVTELAQSAVDTVRGTLGIRSPSRVMMELGGYTAEGFAAGVEGGRGRVGRSLGDMASGGVEAAAGALGSGGGAGAQINVQVVVQAAPGQDPEETGRGVGRGIVRELTGLVELLNLGPAPAPEPA